MLLKKMKKLSLRLNQNYYSALPYPSLLQVESIFMFLYLSICSVFLFGDLSEELVLKKDGI